VGLPPRGHGAHGPGGFSHPGGPSARGWLAAGRFRLARPDRSGKLGAGAGWWVPLRKRAVVELVLLGGLQASGKSSFSRARVAGTHEHVSRDNFPNNRNPARRQAVLVEEALRAGRSVVVDNTNPTPEDRPPL